MTRVFWDTNLFVYLFEGGEFAARVDLFITNDDRLSRKHVADVKFITSLERTYL